LPISAAFCPLIPESETQANWFQRSGSIMVILGVFVEFKLLSIDGHFDLYNIKYEIPFDLPKSYRFTYKFLLRSALVVVILGTLIWGYGDLLF